MSKVYDVYAAFGRMDNTAICMLFAGGAVLLAVYANERSAGMPEDKKRGVLASALVLVVCLCVAGFMIAEAARDNKNVAAATGVVSLFRRLT